jgi:hypothetical protein
MKTPVSDFELVTSHFFLGQQFTILLPPRSSDITEPKRSARSFDESDRPSVVTKIDQSTLEKVLGEIATQSTLSVRTVHTVCENVRTDFVLWIAL